ncbi:hypothetical protein CAEBREN_05684 [Caenorhabditis brenneri]|uniref:Uncharacterized protein n=1 Tax=Caenorhabditis brenneri TaxID=135651 RepID=G0NJ20_CAEBE|nr:hypothetical protein CAEBREN_05684 [Caenorhabditis brenneri]
MEKSGGKTNQAQNLPQDLPFGFNPSVPPPPLYQDVWNLNSVPLPFDSNQAGEHIPIHEHSQAPASETVVIQGTKSQQSAQNSSAPNSLLPGINPLPGIKTFCRKNRPFPEPVYFYKAPNDQYANFNKYLHASPKAYRHTLPPTPKIPKFGAPLLPREPYVEPQYRIQEEAQNIMFSDFGFMQNRDPQELESMVSQLEASLSPREPYEEPQVNNPDVDESPTQDITEGLPNGNSETPPEQPTSSDSKKGQYRCSNCKKFTKKIVGKKTKKPEHWICRSVEVMV